MKLPEKQQTIVDTLLAYVQQQFPELDDLVVGYGSYFEGNPNKYSDVDFFFVPTTHEGNAVANTFILDEIGYDFWPVSWERLTGFVNFEEPLVSLLMDGVVLYSRNENVLQRYNDLKQQAQEHLREQDRRFLHWKAHNYINKAKTISFPLLDDESAFSTIRTACVNCFSELLNALALLNGTYVKKGSERFHDEITRFAQIPDGFAAGYDLVFETDSSEVLKSTTVAMVKAVESMLKDTPKEDDNLAEHLAGFFEKLKSMFNKIYHGVETRNRLKCFYGANGVDIETRAFLGAKMEEYGFPILTDYLDDLLELAEKTRQHEALWLKLLDELGVEVIRYHGIEAFKKDLLKQ